MDILIPELGSMLSVVAVAMVIVLLAMAIDLISGINKARQNGKMCTSWGLKRTVSKFIMYEGAMLIAAGVDILLHASHLYDLLSMDAIRGVPVVTCLMGIFFCIVEFLSVKEDADTKMRKEFSAASKLIGQIVSKDELTEVIREAIKESRQRTSNMEDNNI